MSRFQPDWVSAPGETIAEMMTERDLGHAQLAEQLALTEDALTRLLAGDLELDATLALRLGNTFGATSGFWVTRERHYRAALARVSAAAAQNVG